MAGWGVGLVWGSGGSFGGVYYYFGLFVKFAGFGKKCVGMVCYFWWIEWESGIVSYFLFVFFVWSGSYVGYDLVIIGFGCLDCRLIVILLEWNVGYSGRIWVGWRIIFFFGSSFGRIGVLIY